MNISKHTSVQRGYKYPLYPTDSQKELFAKTFGCTRKIWNMTLDTISKEYAVCKDINDNNPNAKKVYPDTREFSLINRITPIKDNPDYSYFKEVSSVVLQQKLGDLGKAFTAFKRGNARFPQFRKKFAKNSFRLTVDGFRFKDGQCYIAKSKEPLAIGYNGRLLPSEPSSCTISQTPDGKYWISFVCERDPILTSGTAKTGCDLGIKHFLITSDGAKIDNDRYYVGLEKRLGRLQQKLARQFKGVKSGSNPVPPSNNYIKTKKQIAKLHAKIRNRRHDFHHQLSCRLVNENQVLVFETLRVKNMVKNHHLAKHITNAAWSKFVSMTEYKALESHHCSVVHVHAFYPSSHVCSSCNTIRQQKLKLSDREWTCSTCGTHHDRDINAAKSLLSEGMCWYNEGNQPHGKIILAEQRMFKLAA